MQVGANDFNRQVGLGAQSPQGWKAANPKDRVVTATAEKALSGQQTETPQKPLPQLNATNYTNAPQEEQKKTATVFHAIQAPTPQASHPPSPLVNQTIYAPANHSPLQAPVNHTPIFAAANHTPLYAPAQANKKNNLGPVKNIFSGAMSKIKKAAGAVVGKIGGKVAKGNPNPVQNNRINAAVAQPQNKIADDNHRENLEGFARMQEKEPIDSSPSVAKTVTDPTKQKGGKYTTLDEAFKDYKIDPRKAARITKLTPHIEAGKLLAMVNSFNTTRSEQKALILTFLKVCAKITDGKFPDQPFYLKKTKSPSGETLSFSALIKAPNQFYIGLSKLGAGGNNKVNAAIDVSTGQQLVKRQARDLVINGQFYKISQEAQDEEKLQQDLAKTNSKYIIKPLGVNVMTKVGDAGLQKYVSFMPRMDGDLLHVASKLNAKETVQVLRDAARGYAELHQAGYVHMDIKSENVLIKREEDGSVSAKIHDFGTTRPIGKPCVGGTTIFMPPEFFNASTGILNLTPGRLFPSADSYGIGVLVLQTIAPGTVEEYAILDPQGKVVGTSLAIPNTLKGLFDKLRKNIEADTGPRKELNLQLLDVAEKMMAYPEHRRPTAQEAADRLEEIYQNAT